MEGFSDRRIQLAFTRPVVVRGQVSLNTSEDSSSLTHESVDSSTGRLFMFGRGWYGTEVRSLELGGNDSVYGPAGGSWPMTVVDLSFEPFTWKGFLASDAPTVSDCVMRVKNSMDPIVVWTIAGVDPAVLTDEERAEWRDYFDVGIGRAFVPACIDLWSAALDADNADMRNDRYVACRERMERFSGSPDEENLRRTAGAADVLELLDRPYLSLTPLERQVLRLSLGESGDCVWYYPQLFTGRWIPFPDAR